MERSIRLGLSDRVCIAMPTNDKVKLTFIQGASLPDPDKLFNGGQAASGEQSISARATRRDGFVKNIVGGRRGSQSRWPEGEDSSALTSTPSVLEDEAQFYRESRTVAITLQAGSRELVSIWVREGGHAPRDIRLA